jgi:hypothetical protein
MVRQELKTLFCERFECPPADYEDRAFRRWLYWHARFLAPVIRKLSPNFFAEDFKLVRYLGVATGKREAHTELLCFQDANRSKPSLLRTGLRIRVSGRKAASYAEQLFAEVPRNGTKT